MKLGNTSRLAAALGAAFLISHLGCNSLRKKAIEEMTDGAVTLGTDTSQGTETSTVMCGGNQTLTYTKKTFDVASGPALRVGGHCVVTCTDCTIKAPEGVMVGGNGTLTLTGGTLEGSKKAIEAGGNASVTVSGTDIKGKIQHGGRATITGVPGLTDNGQAEKLGKGACDGLFDCYQQHNQSGAVSGKVTATIGADGNATAATYSGGAASRDVQKCMTDLAKTKKVSGAGKSGSLVCEYSGEYGKGGQSLDYSETFQ